MGRTSREHLFGNLSADSAHEIKKTDRRDGKDEKHAATRILREVEGDPRSPLVYDFDEAVYFDHAISKSEPFLQTSEDGAKQKMRHSWFRLEFKAKESHKAIRSGDFLIWAEHPYANGWVNAARFKRPRKESRAARRDTNELEFANGQEFATWFEYLDYDWWETGKYLTAGFSGLSHPWMPRDELRNYHETLADVLGVCGEFPDAGDGVAFFAACERELLEAEEIRKMMRLCENGTYQFWREGPVDEVLARKTCEDGNYVLPLAIRQAMAGPATSNASCRGRRVTYQVEHVFKYHLNNIYRAYQRREGRETGLDGLE